MSDFIQVVNPKLFKRKTIDSFSVICHTIIDGKIYYLLGSVRDTIPFKEFIRANIKEDEINLYLSAISKHEKQRLLNESFDSLIFDVFPRKTTNSRRNISDESREKFLEYRDKYKSFLLNPEIGLEDSPWIFPKGRKNAGESDDDCALREFEEETRILRENIRLYSKMDPLEEIYTGLDNKLYKTVYYTGFMEYDDYVLPNKQTITPYRTTLSNELSGVEWLSYSDAINKLDSTKQYILRLVNTFLIFQLERKPPKRRFSI